MSFRSAHTLKRCYFGATFWVNIGPFSSISVNVCLPVNICYVKVYIGWSIVVNIWEQALKIRVSLVQFLVPAPADASA